MPTPITFLQFARLCAAIYDEHATSAAGFVRGGFVRRISGFQGAYFCRANGTGVDYVVTVAGTQPTDTAGMDIVADAGFGGRVTTGAVGVVAGLPGLNIILAPILAAAPAVLEAQVSLAEQMVALARQAAGNTPGSRVFITGHSLGGGISQIVAARPGVPACCISAPAVTAVPGVEAAWRRNQPDITCLRVRNDPINETGRIGAWLGRIRMLPTNRTGGAAHSIDKTVEELMPSGQFSTVGTQDPFAR